MTMLENNYYFELKFLSLNPPIYNDENTSRRVVLVLCFKSISPHAT